MNIIRLVIRTYLYTQFFINKVTFSGPFGKERADYLKNISNSDKNRLKSNLFKYHVKQFNDASCSVASIVSVLNSVMDDQEILPDKVLTQHDILEKIKKHKWKKRMSPEEDNGKRGLPLYMLGDIVRSCFDTCKIEYKSIKTVQADRNPENQKKIKNLLLERLKNFEKNGSCLIIAHFNQGKYVETIQLPHISPVGGYNEKSGKVTILDVDPEQVLPYEVSFDRFYEGISSNYNNFFKYYGYKSGGYIFVQL